MLHTQLACLWDAIDLFGRVRVYQLVVNWNGTSYLISDRVLLTLCSNSLASSKLEFNISNKEKKVLKTNALLNSLKQDLLLGRQRVSI